ncbi:hypothetical protein Vadar_025559 [Vaccinium darrowii]|uniref:Uncharacterized protein n=1 Tax=Vaccinium darrowii TaxID=229202 RepID=A0ACB7X4G0_9ERIC|nr:hypothetical protein Vadar_025559 [Vaccinium darrowii]
MDLRGFLTDVEVKEIIAVVKRFIWQSWQGEASGLGVREEFCCDKIRMQSENLYASFDSKWLLKSKGEVVATVLNGRCIFLVGMMGSGKTTVGKVLSEPLAYSFVDSDKYVEEALGGSPVAQIIKEFDESSFRDYESEALRNLSVMPRQVVATGGGAATLPINWKYMKEGVSVYLDVPLDALARRIAAVGTDSRPLLDFESGDAYTKAFMSLLTLSKKRRHAYSNADVTVSLEDIAANLGLEGLSDVTPTAIALENFTYEFGDFDSELAHQTKDGWVRGNSIAKISCSVLDTTAKINPKTVLRVKRIENKLGICNDDDDEDKDDNETDGNDDDEDESEGDANHDDAENESDGDGDDKDHGE